MKNRLILWGWWVLTWFGLSEKDIKANNTGNRAVLKKEELWPRGGYIERQSELGALRFGKSYTIAYGGCGLIALYNALVALGEQPTDEVWLKLADDLQRRGAAWGGKYGIYPGAIRCWLKNHDYAIQRLRVSEESFAQNEAEYNVFIVTVLNGSGLRNWLHTVCITRQESGFVVHNGPYGEAFPTLAEAVRNSSRKGATAIYAMGVGRRKDASEELIN